MDDRYNHRYFQKYEKKATKNAFKKSIAIHFLAKSRQYNNFYKNAFFEEHEKTIDRQMSIKMWKCFFLHIIEKLKYAK